MVRFCFEIQEIVFLQLEIKSFDYLTKIVFLPLSPSVHQRDKALLAARTPPVGFQNTIFV